MDRTCPYREGLGLPNNPNSRRTQVHTILVEDISLNINKWRVSLEKSHHFINMLYMHIHSSHDHIKIVTLTICHDYGHSKINSMSQNGID